MQFRDIIVKVLKMLTKEIIIIKHSDKFLYNLAPYIVVVGSVLAILFVTNLPVYWLNWLVVAVVVYTSVTMFKSALSKNDEKELELQAS